MNFFFNDYNDQVTVFWLFKSSGNQLYYLYSQL